MIQAQRGDVIDKQPFWLTEAQMERLKPFFPKSHGKPRVDDRRVLSGIIFINRDGMRWCDAPNEYGPRYDQCPETFFSAIMLAATVLFWL